MPLLRHFICYCPKVNLENGSALGVWRKGITAMVKPVAVFADSSLRENHQIFAAVHSRGWIRVWNIVALDCFASLAMTEWRHPWGVRKTRHCEGVARGSPVKCRRELHRIWIASSFHSSQRPQTLSGLVNLEFEIPLGYDGNKIDCFAQQALKALARLSSARRFSGMLLRDCVPRRSSKVSVLCACSSQPHLHFAQ